MTGQLGRAAIAGIFLLSGCSSAADSSPPTVSVRAVASTAETSTTISIVSTKPVVEDVTSTTEFVPVPDKLVLMSAGEEPRRSLRAGTITDEPNLLVYENVSNQWFVLGNTTTVRSDSNVPMVTTNFSTDLQLEVVEQTSNRFTLRTTLGPSRVGGAGLATSDDDLSQLLAEVRDAWFEQGWTKQWADHQRGPQLPLADQQTSDALASFEDALSLAQIPVPTEPVGLGARWAASATRLVSGLPSSVSSQATVTEVGPDLIQADVVVRISFLPGDAQLPSGPVTILGGQSTLVGSLTWRVELPVALYELSGSSTLRLEFEDPENGQRSLSQETEQTYVLRPR